MTVQQHERSARISFYNTVMLGTTWGSPILVGSLAQSAGGILNQFMTISIFQSIGIVLLILVSKETSFYRSTTNPFPSKSEIEVVIEETPKSKFSSYIRSLHPMPYYDSPSASLLTQPLRYLASPKTALLFLMSGLLPATAFAIGNSLPLIYSTLPMMLFSTKIGYLFTLPFILTLLSHFLLTSLFTSFTPTYNQPTISASNILTYAPRAASKPSPKKQLFLTIPALLFGIAGLITFGLYNSFHTHMITSTTGINHTTSKMMTGDSSMSLQIVSFFFGLAVTGGLMLQLSASAYITASTPPKTNTRSAVYTETSLQFYRNVLMGAMVLGLPGWVHGPRAFVMTFAVVGGVQVVCVGVAVVGLCVFGGWVEWGGVMVVGMGNGKGKGEGGNGEEWKVGASFMEV